MEEMKLACVSAECVVPGVLPQRQPHPDLRTQILQLLNARLSDSAISVLQAQLQLMQRSSYYLEVRREAMTPTGDPQHAVHLSESAVWSLIDHRRLQRAMSLAHTQVKLLLALLAMLCQEVVSGCRELQAFIIKNDQGVVSGDTAALMQQKLQQTCQHISDFESRMTRNLGELDLENQLIPNTGNFPVPQLSASLTLKMPVVFDKFESCTTSSTVHLCWEVAGQVPKEPNQQFEIHMKSLHPTVDQGQFNKYLSSSYSMQVNNLIPDRYYQFSVKRVDSVNLVYGPWVDTIILKTLAVSE